MTMKPQITAQDVHEREQDLAVQPELELLHTTKLEKGVLPKTICLMYVHQRKMEWRQVQEQCRGFGCGMDDDTWVWVVRQGTEVIEPELTLATFDEVALKKHIATWGTRVHERESTYFDGSGPKKLMNKYETWLSYKKIEFQQLEGVRLYPDERSIEIEELVKERETNKKVEEKQK